jgi:hypothetical protein
VVLLTERQRAAPIGLPVALRLELEQPQQGMVRSRVVKERRGRIGMPVELAPKQALFEECARVWG